jgi:hypothetical protein
MYIKTSTVSATGERLYNKFVGLHHTCYTYRKKNNFECDSTKRFGEYKIENYSKIRVCIKNVIIGLQSIRRMIKHDDEMSM